MYRAIRSCERKKLINEAKKTLRGVFAVYKEPSVKTADVTNMLQLQMNDDFSIDTRVINIPLHVAEPLAPNSQGVLIFGLGGNSKQVYRRNFEKVYHLVLQSEDTSAKLDFQMLEKYCMDSIGKPLLQTVDSSTPECELINDRRPSSKKTWTAWCTKFEFLQKPSASNFSLNVHTGPWFNPNTFISKLNEDLGVNLKPLVLERISHGPITKADTLKSYEWSVADILDSSKRFESLLKNHIAK